MKKTKEETKKKSNAGSEKPKSSFFTDERIRFVGGILVSSFAIYLLIAFIAFLFYWKPDQSQITKDLLDTGSQAKNWSGKLGARLSELIVRNGFGIGSFFIPLILGSIGLHMLKFPKIKVWRLIAIFTFATIIVSLILGYISGARHLFLGSGLGGAQGFEATKWLNTLIGKPGTGICLIFISIVYLVYALNVSPTALRIRIPAFLKKKETENVTTPEDKTENPVEANPVDESGDPENGPAVSENEELFSVINKKAEESVIEEAEVPEPEGSIIHDLENEDLTDPIDYSGVSLEITKAEAGDLMSEQEVQKIMENYDPRLDLSRYKFPPVSILKDHKGASAFDNTEVIENKENIIKTLGDHKIPIKHISATVGPTVTLYEIVPERGVRLAKIKSLENDIALNLSALGIRIIAPIPGRGTVGIEVPNKKPELVSMRSLIASKAFQETKFDIALALGRTITNDAYIVDLTKMPHLLVAGATGQGKSVGINAIITSILYKKHPSEVKFVLIDPKRVELPLYAKIERHFLAKLPDEEDAIITDTQKVIKTLNSLCIEMDNRLELLKAAQSRHIKEYNEKFIARKLSPEKGHKYMPYIVLIIDEFADLIMTAGREIEGPIGRLAQLARAIGIHLIISTQRPSANIITGFIKANFPTRIAFRVFSSVDSRTILDATGADRLVGRGDMLISSGNEPVRVQCAFIDTPEIEELTDFIGSQQGYADAMHLPEYIDDNEAGMQDIDLRKRDPMFDEAAKLVVTHQQGSTSLIQRKLAIGYNRAGRIIDQLEAAKIVGPFEGSKARDVLISDLMSLDQILKSLE